MNLFTAFILSTLAFGLPLAAVMPEPYASIRNLPYDGHGWFINEKQMEECMKTCNPTTVIEVGSWLGLSTRFMAMRMPKGSKLYAVDTWLGSPAEEVHMKDPRLPYLYQLFLSNVKHAGLTEIIVPVRMDSVEASKALNVQADLIYVDAAHDADSVYRDIMAWYPHLRKGGIFCGDDWGWESVRQGVMKAAGELGVSIDGTNNFWKFY